MLSEEEKRRDFNSAKSGRPVRVSKWKNEVLFWDSQITLLWQRDIVIQHEGGK